LGGKTSANPRRNFNRELHWQKSYASMRPAARTCFGSKSSRSARVRDHRRVAVSFTGVNQCRSRSRGRPRAGCRAPTARSRTGSVSPGIGSDGEGDGERKREDDEGGKQRTTHEASTRAGSSCIPAGGFSDRGPQSMSVACKTPGRGAGSSRSQKETVGGGIACRRSKS